MTQQGGSEVAALVERARTGDRGAFGALVRRHQSMALAYAWSLLGDREAARDATQEAFIDAFLALEQLHEPAAFSAWLRRIVFKHCDRHRRRRRERPDADAIDAARAPDLPPASERLEQAEQNARLYTALDALPVELRQVAAATWLAGEAQADVARFLDLPLSTVKHRLREARARLRKETWMTTRVETQTPSTPEEPMARRIELFLAARTGDVATIGSLLESDPSLIEARESWSIDEARDLHLPVAAEATPLIRAAEGGHVDLVRLLLARGAGVDGACGCATSESALWAAAVFERPEVAAILLGAGADPNRPAGSGTTPLHAAAIRGHAGLVSLLLEHGADPGRRTASGLRAVDFARDRGFEAVVALLEASGPSGDSSGSAARPEAGPVGERGEESAALRITGIKAIDLLCPLPSAGLVECVGGAAVGRNVLLAELARALRDREGGRSFWTIWEQADWEAAENEALVAETATRDAIEIVAATVDAGASTRRALAFEAFARARRWQAEHGRPASLVVFEAPGHAVDVDALAPRLVDGRVNGLLGFVVRPWSRVDAGVDRALAAPFAARIVFDPARAARRRFPAIDPERSASIAFARGLVSERHTRLATAARRLLVTRSEVARAERLEAILTQPFRITEPFTGRSGTSASLEETLAEVEAVLEGRFDGVPVEALLYRSPGSGAPGSP